jgi:hypothetical protein
LRGGRLLLLHGGRLLLHGGRGGGVGGALRTAGRRLVILLCRLCRNKNIMLRLPTRQMLRSLLRAFCLFSSRLAALAAFLRRDVGERRAMASFFFLSFSAAFSSCNRYAR